MELRVRYQWLQSRFEEADMFRSSRLRIGAAWCRLTHASLMWPVHGHYDCRTCGRRYPAFTETPIAGWSNEIAGSGSSAVGTGSASPSLGRA
jgi:hypothetical protein